VDKTIKSKDLDDLDPHLPWLSNAKELSLKVLKQTIIK
ncbi:unnamed protein product, partial [Acidithrix sp. C25]